MISKYETCYKWYYKQNTTPKRIFLYHISKNILRKLNIFLNEFNKFMINFFFFEKNIVKQ